MYIDVANLRNMKKNRLFFIMVTALTLIFSCKKPADVIEGLYSGSVIINSSPAGSGTVALSKVSDNVVNLTFTIGANPPNVYNNVSVAGVENPYSLSYSDASGNLYGGVSGNEINFTLFDTSGTQTSFTGVK